MPERKGLVLIPFRDTPDGLRLSQLQTLENVLRENKILYDVIVQENDYPFNRGILLNEGVLRNPNYDYYIFHDCDLVPDYNLIKHYRYMPPKPVHLGYRGQRWSSSKLTFIGGVFSISKKDFIKVFKESSIYWNNVS